MLNPFRQPYRETGTRKGKIISIVAFGLFIFLFLFIFKPFGLFELNTIQALFITLGFGAITAFVLFVFKFLLEPLLSTCSRTLGRHIIWDFVIATSIGVANYTYMSVIFDIPFSLKYLLYAVWTAWLVGLIPVIISYIINYNKQYREALKVADIPEEKIFRGEAVKLTAGNDKNEVTLDPEDILYICSNDNYVTVATLKEGSVSRITIRGTLKAVEEELSRNKRFLRCHKCYIINLNYIDRIIGHSQNMKVRLLHSDELIPVSRVKAGLLTGS